jgi:hypothetical protein
MAIRDELKLFIEEFKRTNGRIPTQNEIVKGTGRAAKTIKSYLVEGVDYAKPLTKLEAAKLGGRKTTGITDVSDDLIKQFKNLKFTHISPSVSTSPSTGSKSFRVRFTGPIANDFKDIFLPATKENLRIIANDIDDIVTGNLYKNKAKVFKTDEQFRKLRRLKDAMYREKDPYGVYEKLRKYKSKIFPGDASKDIQIQHGQPKFSTQTLSRFGFIPKEVNISPEVEKVERIRNEKLSAITKKLKNPNISIGDKEKLIEEFNDTMKGLRGQLKGTKGQGLVNFELLDIDQDGNVTKLKDTGFDPKKGLVASDEDLSKITKERADELIKLGKEKIDAEAVKLKLIPADQISTPEKSKVREMFQTAFKKVPKKGKVGLAAAAITGVAGKGIADELPIEYNDEIGAFVDPKTDDKVSQATLLDWAANNPMPTAAIASTPLLSKTVRKGTGKLLKGLLSTLGSSAAGLTFAGMTVKDNLDEGKNIVDATVDPLVGLELLYPEAAKRFGGKGLQNALGRALSLGRVGAMMTPVGLGITALGVGKELYNVAQEEQDRINEMRENDPMAYQEYLAEQQELMDVSA